MAARFVSCPAFDKLCALTALCASCFSATGANALELVWDPSPDTSVVSYSVYSLESGTCVAYRHATEGANGRLTDLKPGSTYFIYVTATSASGEESRPSNFVLYIHGQGGWAADADQLAPLLASCAPLTIVDAPILPKPVLTGRDVSLSWKSPGAGVRLQRATRLADPDWEDIHGSEQNPHFSASATQDCAFFRLRKL
jgi:hypothetical protein